MKILKILKIFDQLYLWYYFILYKKIYFMFLSLQKFLLKTTYWYYTEDEKLLKITEISVSHWRRNLLKMTEISVEVRLTEISVKIAED